jgi:hypothetical protein
MAFRSRHEISFKWVIRRGAVRLDEIVQAPLNGVLNRRDWSAHGRCAEHCRAGIFVNCECGTTGITIVSRSLPGESSGVQSQDRRVVRATGRMGDSHARLRCHDGPGDQHPIRRARIAKRVRTKAASSETWRRERDMKGISIGIGAARIGLLPEAAEEVPIAPLPAGTAPMLGSNGENLGDIISLIQMRHIKLCYAGQSRQLSEVAPVVRAARCIRLNREHRSDPQKGRPLSGPRL